MNWHTTSLFLLGLAASMGREEDADSAVKGFENEDKSSPKDLPSDGTGLFRPAIDRRALSPEKQPAPFVVL